MSTFNKIWRIPLILGITTLFGLLAALLGTGIWYPVAWTALAVPLIIITVKLVRKM